MPTTFDTTALRAEVDRSKVRSFRKQALTSGDPRWRPRFRLGMIAVWIVAAVLAPFMVASATTFGRPAGWAVAVWILTFGVIVAIGVLGARSELGLSAWTEHLRCRRFAADNQMTYLPRSEPANYPGTIFQLGHSREALRRVSSDAGPIMDCGIHAYTTGSGKRRREHYWRYAAIRLPGPLPHMMLDARANNTFESNLPVPFAADQRLSLGGEMDRHFDLYCPKEYGFDAYYIFTPDLMAHLIDYALAFDVEVVDDWMFLYTRYELSITDPATWTQLAAIRDTVMQLMHARAQTYQDHRATDPPGQLIQPGTAPGERADAARPPLETPTEPPPAIAPAGRRLRKSRNWVAIAGVVLFAVVWVFRDVITNFLRGLLG